MKIENEGMIIETHYYCPPGLKRHRFFIDSMEKRVPDPGTPSGLLMAELRERERAASEVVEPCSVLNDRDLSSDEKIEREEFNDFVEEVEKSDPEKGKRKLRTLSRINKKIETLVFDDTAVKQGELEDEAYELLNKDGFYDEILPIDYDEDAPEKDNSALKTLVIYGGLLIVLVGFIIWYLKYIVF